MEQLCCSCPECQWYSDILPPRAALQPLLVVEKHKMALSVTDPFPKSSAGYQFILVMMDYATCYPEVIPMKTVTVPKVVEKLIKWIARVGIPQEILTDQRTISCPRF